MSRVRGVLDALSLAPFQAALGIVGIISGATTIAGIAPASIATALPAPLILGWAITIMIGSPLMLTGLVAQIPRIEQAGLVLLAAATGIYGVAIVAMQPAAAATAAGTYLLYALACLLRIRVLGMAMRASKALED